MRNIAGFFNRFQLSLKYDINTITSVVLKLVNYEFNKWVNLK